MKNQSAFLTSSNVRAWVAGLRVEEFLASGSRKASVRKIRSLRSKAKPAGTRSRHAA